ncbi:hypothetical protein RQP46_008586 [Phenoliferia psychrophenolica]
MSTPVASEAAPAPPVASTSTAPPPPAAPTPAPPPTADATPSTSTAPAPAAAPTPGAPTPAPVTAPVVAGATAPPADGLTQTELRKKLDGSRRDLRGYLDKKKRIDRELANLEASIHAFEGSYLSDALLPASSAASVGSSSQFGNIIKGYESYLKPGPSTGGDRKRGRVGEEARDADRMFSRSSATFQKALDMRSTDIIESASEEESTGTGRKKRKH